MGERLYGVSEMEPIATTGKATKVTLPRPWDFVGIMRWEGEDGVRKRYYTLRPFAETCMLLGDMSWAPHSDWYTRPKLVMTLAALQAEWDECNSIKGQAWIACRFWTQEVACLRAVRLTGGPGAGLAEEQRPENLEEYLDGPGFAEFVKVLRYLARRQRSADNFVGLGERNLQTGGKVA